MNTQKGFVSILIILLAIVAMGGGVYVYDQKNDLGMFSKKEVTTNPNETIKDEEKNNIEIKTEIKSDTESSSKEIKSVVIDNAQTENSSTCGSFNRILKLGSNGQDVASLQDFLVKQNLLTVSVYTKGKFEESTKTALDAYQEANFGIDGRRYYNYGVLSGITMEIINDRCNGIVDSVSVAQKRGKDAAVKARINSTITASIIYGEKEGTYKGLCSSAVKEIEDLRLLEEFTKDVVCNDSEKSWAISAYLPSTEGKYYCYDSTEKNYYPDQKLKSGQVFCVSN